MLRNVIHKAHDTSVKARNKILLLLALTTYKGYALTNSKPVAQPLRTPQCNIGARHQ